MVSMAAVWAVGESEGRVRTYEREYWYAVGLDHLDVSRDQV